MDTLFEINAYHWLALGLLLFAAEALGAAGFLLGTAAAAVAVGLITLAAPGLAVSAQLALFAVVAIAASGIYLKMFRREQDAMGDSGLNHRAAGLIGHEFELTEPLPGGVARVQIGDTLWRVETSEPLPAGTRVRVVEADEMSLRLATRS